jgi:hypothetical protein
MKKKAVHYGIKETKVGSSTSSDSRGTGKRLQFGKKDVINCEKAFRKPIVKPTKNNDE